MRVSFTDLNGDGVADLLALDAGSLNNNVFFYLGIGRASFVGRPALSAPAGAQGVAVGDWDGDGKQDVVTLSSMGDSVCVLRNTSN